MTWLRTISSTSFLRNHSFFIYALQFCFMGLGYIFAIPFEISGYFLLFQPFFILQRLLFYEVFGKLNLMAFFFSNNLNVLISCWVQELCLIYIFVSSTHHSFWLILHTEKIYLLNKDINVSCSVWFRKPNNDIIIEDKVNKILFTCSLFLLFIGKIN